jgi:Sortase domain
MRPRRPRVPARPSRADRRAGRRAAGHWPAGRRPALVVTACGVLACLVGAGGLVIASQAARGPRPPGPVPVVPVPDGRLTAPLGAAANQVAARPVRLVIPAIGVRTALIRLGTTSSGSLQVPPTTAVAGWYDGSPRPGEIGSAVIAGHVDSFRGPGVFFRLRLLRQADRVYVRRSDGSLVSFRVTAVREYRKDRFPTAAVYGPVPDAQLRLITCGGTFDPALRSYLSNVVVFAVAVGGSRA